MDLWFFPFKGLWKGLIGEGAWGGIGDLLEGFNSDWRISHGVGLVNFPKKEVIIPLAG